MSSIVVRALLETAVSGMSPALATAFENAPFTPVVGTPYQRVSLLLAEPAPVNASGTLNREQGILQINLAYPLGGGPGPAQARAELIRQTFYRGRTLTDGEINVTIDRMPEIAPALVEDDRFVIPVRARFYSYNSRS